MTHQERALSETVSQLLIIFLVILVTLLIIASLTGVLTKFLQQPAFIVATASQFNASSGAHIISLNHKQGDKVNLNGTSQRDGSSEIAIMLTASSGSTALVRNDTLLQAPAWGPGQYLYIYPSGGSIVYSDIPPLAPASFIAGDYTIQIIDTKAKILLHTLPVRIS
jgi:hypothetical protein